MINQAGLDLIKHWEGIRATPYKDSAGIWTIGYGHTLGVTADTPPCTPAQANAWLVDDTMKAESDVNLFLKQCNIVLNENQYSALVCLVFNVGPKPLKGTLGRLLMEGKFSSAALAFSQWIYIHDADGKPIALSGLEERRLAEAKLFGTPI